MSKTIFFVVQTITFSDADVPESRISPEFNFDEMAKNYGTNVQYKTHEIINTGNNLSMVVTYERDADLS